VTEPSIYLASASPRRTELLTQVAISHLCRPVGIDETPLPDEPALDYVQRMAQSKARALFSSEQYQLAIPVLGADTIVVKNQQILQKPNDLNDCQRILKLLSGSEHQVYSAICVLNDQQLHIKYAKTVVHLRELSDSEINQYWQTGEPQDKAGAYGIQGLASAFVKSIEGSYSNVVGLPLFECLELLKQFNIDPLANASQHT
jgi:septum formation protein